MTIVSLRRRCQRVRISLAIGPNPAADAEQMLPELLAMGRLIAPGWANSRCTIVCTFKEKGRYRRLPKSLIVAHPEGLARTLWSSAVHRGTAESGGPRASHRWRVWHGRRIRTLRPSLGLRKLRTLRGRATSCTVSNRFCRLCWWWDACCKVRAASE